MKNLLTLLLLIPTLVNGAMLTCPQLDEYQSLLAEKKDTWCNNERFSEGANELFELEAHAYRDKYLTPLLQDNIHDMKWLVRKSTQDIRKHAFCLELICHTIQTACADNKAYTVEKDQASWCETRATEFGKIEQEKTQQVITENQQRKSRSNLREKMRSIEIRTSHLFIPLLQKFYGEYHWFTDKTPTFLNNPL
jgi:hypothetical protein